LVSIGVAVIYAECGFSGINSVAFWYATGIGSAALSSRSAACLLDISSLFVFDQADV